MKQDQGLSSFRTIGKELLGGKRPVKQTDMVPGSSKQAESEGKKLDRPGVPQLKEVTLYGVRFIFNNPSPCMADVFFVKKFEAQALFLSGGLIPEAKYQCMLIKFESIQVWTRSGIRTFAPEEFPFRQNYIIAYFETEKAAIKVSMFFKCFHNRTILIDGFFPVTYRIQKSIVHRKEHIQQDYVQRTGPTAPPLPASYHGRTRSYEITENFDPCMISYNASGVLSYPLWLQGNLMRIDVYPRNVLRQIIVDLNRTGQLGTLTVVDPVLRKEMGERFYADLLQYSCLLDRPAYMGIIVAMFLWSETFLSEHYLPLMRADRDSFIYGLSPKVPEKEGKKKADEKDWAGYNGCYVFHGLLRLLGMDIISEKKINRWLDVARRTVNDEFFYSTNPGRMNLVKAIRAKKWKPIFGPELEVKKL